MLSLLVRGTRIQSVRGTARDVGQAMVEGLYAHFPGVRPPVEA